MPWAITPVYKLIDGQKQSLRIKVFINPPTKKVFNHKIPELTDIHSQSDYL